MYGHSRRICPENWVDDPSHNDDGYFQNQRAGTFVMRTVNRIWSQPYILVVADKGTLWELPGGGRQHDDADPVDRALDELRSEAGIEVDREAMKWIGLFRDDRCYEDQCIHHHLTEYFATNGMFLAPNTTSPTAWLTIDELIHDPRTHPCVRRAVKRYTRELRDFARIHVQYS